LVAATAKFSELVVLPIKGASALDVLLARNAANLAARPVIDATNPIDNAPSGNGVLKLFTNLDESLGERLQHEFGQCAPRQSLQLGRQCIHAW
jgi:8-hydroxy-5-deazaflavin:NADPH oxidoreductase